MSSFIKLDKLGFKKSLMEITGTPAYDKIFQKLIAFTRAKKEKGKTTVLFLPMYYTNMEFGPRTNKIKLLKKS